MAFKSLVSAVSEQCQEIKQALANFAYFETWESDIISECCRVSSVAEFPPHTIILGPDTGNSHTVYFIVEGVCKMVQHMHVKVTTGSQGFRGNSSDILKCKRYRHSDSRALNPEAMIEGYKSRLLTEGIKILGDGDVKNCETANFSQEGLKETGQKAEEELVSGEEVEFLKSTEVSEPTQQVEENTVKSPSEEQESEIPEDKAPEINEENQPNLENPDPTATETSEDFEGKSDFHEANEASGETTEEKIPDVKEEPQQKEDIKLPPEINDSKIPPDPQQQNEEKIEQESEFQREADTEVPEVTFEPDHHLKVLEECKKRRNETISVCKKGSLPEKFKNVKSVFIQTGFLLKGACFGLEKCENFIMTYTKVKCLKIPQRFLLKHNPCNVWNRIRLFHALYLPKDERIFENFKSDRLWTNWKKNLSKEIVSRRNIPNYTLESDVPYSIRLVDVR